MKKASLEYLVLERTEGTTLVRVKLHTGRTHQIRVQFASRGTPLAGDRRYGAPAESGQALCLTASELSFVHPDTSERMYFSLEKK